MPSWAEFAAAEPELAAKVRERFGIRKHKTMASLRKDGSPRISGIETEFADGELYLGMMPDSRKLHDLQRDPRVALHSPTDDPPMDQPAAWLGEAKVSGIAHEVAEPPSPVPGAARMRIEIREVAFTHLNAAGDRLVVDWWRAGGNRQRTERT
ncbi:MAG: pyridoxamine 5-phosphate oxidase [Chloroflexi bacterium]|nr:MAG: pyridoxamine 5-phosphate oxidase [Chloroflexota bacterium]TME46977.1 MAG: pyridoxamine 5-phosphate oxidase [Chloroflexota bacterium]